MFVGENLPVAFTGPLGMVEVDWPSVVRVRMSFSCITDGICRISHDLFSLQILRIDRTAVSVATSTCIGKLVGACGCRRANHDNPANNWPQIEQLITAIVLRMACCPQRQHNKLVPDCFTTSGTASLWPPEPRYRCRC